MPQREPIQIMIHDLNPYGGQDRSMLEIAWQLNKEFPLDIHSFSLEGYEQWPDMKHIPYRNAIKRPILAKYLNYHFNSWRKLRHSPHPLIQSTGTASLKSNVVQVQFIHHTWQKIAQNLPQDKEASRSLTKRSYRRFLNQYKIHMEKTLYTPEKNYIAISHSIKKELMEHFNIPNQNIDIIYHGVDTEYFRPYQEVQDGQSVRKSIREEYGLKESDIVLLHVGALNARKGLFKSLEALSFLKKQGFNNVYLLAVGQGDQKILEQSSQKWQVEDRLLMASHSRDIRQYYWASDLFFFPTFYEPFGLVILEAMACGLPVAVSQFAGGAELINDKVNGTLFDPWASAESIANDLLPVLRDKTSAHEMAKRARQTALEHTWEEVGQKYRELYSRLYQQNQVQRSSFSN